MATGILAHRTGSAPRLTCVVAAAITALLLGACAGGGEAPLSLTNDAEPEKQHVVDANAPPRTELEKATEYWGKAHKKSPGELQTAINYAKNLRALGQKQQALAVYQSAHETHSGDRTLNSEYGRLALELDQFSTAQKLLEQADDPAKPDWKTISARGTVLAKQGKYNEAVPLFERALAASPGQPSVLNNLALARAMDGHPDKAEALLRQAAAGGSDDPKITQNLSLVLGLQGKYDEAKVAGQKALSADSASDDVGYVRQMVKLEPRGGAASQPATMSPKNAVADAGQTATKKIATGSTTKRKPAGAAETAVDALAAVTALADANTAGQAPSAKAPTDTTNDAFRPKAK